MRFTQGNLLDADAEALVNTVNTVGVMGKGIALMFKERFPENTRRYEAACMAGEVMIGRMFVTERHSLVGPRYIINFPTKKHWRSPSRLEWIEAGLTDLAETIRARSIKSVAIPPLGAGNGGLDWDAVRPLIERMLTKAMTDIVVYEPTATYHNVVKRRGTSELTPGRAILAEMIRRYAARGIDCTVLEVQKLAWFLQKAIGELGLPDPLRLRFEPNRYGPYSDALRHLLNKIDGSYIRCERRLADAAPLTPLWFRDDKRDAVRAYLTTDEAKPYHAAIERAASTIEGFQSPFGLELLTTVDWLHREDEVPLATEPMLDAIRSWKGADASAAARKARLFKKRDIDLAIAQLTGSADIAAA